MLDEDDTESILAGKEAPSISDGLTSDEEEVSSELGADSERVESRPCDQATDANASASDASTGIRPGKLREAPSEHFAALALKDLKLVLRGPSKGKGGGYKHPVLDPFVRHRLEGMRTFLNLYVNLQSRTRRQWSTSALQASVGLGHGTYCAAALCKLARQYIHDRNILPVNPYGNWNESLLVDEDIAAAINLHLQELGLNITAAKVVEFLALPEI